MPARESIREPQIALCFGSREWRDTEPIEADLADLAANSIVVHGGARGADMLADKIARQMGLHVARVDALWKFHGKKAGPIRNEMMLALGVTHAYGYSLGTPGTADMKGRVLASSISLRWHVAKWPVCGSIMLGSGGDSWDPTCELPSGHKGTCKSSSATDQNRLVA